MRKKLRKTKICIVTSSRAEYGILRWLMEEIEADKRFRLQLLVTGAHLSKDYGLTYHEIEKDGFKISKKVPMFVSSYTKAAIAESIGRCTIGVSNAFRQLDPDLIIILGDRYELLSVCSSAVVMGIPIAHISGGDITEGSIDEQVRHAVTKMAHIHFPGTPDSAKRIIQMGEDPKRVFVVGELGIDGFYKLKVLPKNEMANNLGLRNNKRWVMLTYHPETVVSLSENLRRIKNILSVLREIEDIDVIATYPNADYGSRHIIELLEKECLKSRDRFKLVKSLGQPLYIGLMRMCSCVVGNSSSGIIESPSARIPVVNIGNRQKGRIISRNIICVSGEKAFIKKGILKALSLDFRKKLTNLNNPYGIGKAADNIVKILRKLDIGTELLNKTFFNI